MGKVSNVFSMLELLNNNKKYSIKELSDILEVTPRMIRSYKDDLEKAGIYIDTIRGPYGGYVLNQSVRIPYRKFNYNDYLLLDKVCNDISDNKLKKDLDVQADKVRGIYLGSKSEEKELNLKEETLKKYNLLTRAIKEKRKVKILYYSYTKGENERIIHPYDMFLFINGWGVAAYCELRKDIRHFELKRIIKYELLDEFYE
jgi:predicted DNA-binding transcriptional regulator YafY